jgi:hypothetical protein
MPIKKDLLGIKFFSVSPKYAENRVITVLERRDWIRTHYRICDMYTREADKSLAL